MNWLNPAIAGFPIDPAHPHGRYGDCGEDATMGYVNTPEPKPVVRMPGRQEAEGLERLIHGTQCTVAEVNNGRCILIYGSTDDILGATHILRAKGYSVDWVQRK